MRKVRKARKTKFELDDIPAHHRKKHRTHRHKGLSDFFSR